MSVRDYCGDCKIEFFGYHACPWLKTGRKCAETVRRRTGALFDCGSPCVRRAQVIVGGKPYCTQHGKKHRS